MEDEPLADEAWPDMAERIEGEVADEHYSKRLFSSYLTFRKVGFKWWQAWLLTRDEHNLRLQQMVDVNMFHLENGTGQSD